MSNPHSALGSPQNRQFSGNLEVWQYCSNGFEDTHRYVAVVFRGSNVVEQRSYTRSAFYDECTGKFETLVAEDRPDTILEVRRR